MRLAVRLVSMVDIGPIATNIIQGPEFVRWNDETQNLSEVLLHSFTKSVQSPQGTRFDTGFSAYNIEHLAGIKIQWVANLADHLRLVDDDDERQVLCVFRHATFLKRQKERFVHSTL